MKELKDLNEERPRLLQLLNTAQCTLKTKLDQLNEKMAFAQTEQRLLQEKLDLRRADMDAKEKMLQCERLHQRNSSKSYDLLESSVNSLHHGLQSLTSEKV
mmetsp:Transcript_20275/g.27897  ORF Transcript_20275/g.27897 Transcript_20275/m.27897 type:complete len:101 (-) Transcript_20275:3328-3630(-)